MGRVSLFTFRAIMGLELQAHVRGRHPGDPAEPSTAQAFRHGDERLALTSICPLVNDEHRFGFFRLILRESGRSAHCGGNAEPRRSTPFHEPSVTFHAITARLPEMKISAFEKHGPVNTSAVRAST